MKTINGILGTHLQPVARCLLHLFSLLASRNALCQKICRQTNPTSNDINLFSGNSPWAKRRFSNFSLDMLDRGCKELLVRQTCTQALFDRMVTSTVETKTEIVRGRFWQKTDIKGADRQTDGPLGIIERRWPLFRCSKHWCLMNSWSMIKKVPLV